MLRIHYGSLPEEIYDTAMYFRNVYQEEWLDDDFSKRMIKSIDRSEVIGDRLIASKALGKISPLELSGGVKTLLLIYNLPDKVFNVTTCGDNCAYWLLRLAYKAKRERPDNPDILVCMHHIMDFGNGRFTVEVENTGRIVHSMAELAVEAGMCLREDFDHRLTLDSEDA